MGKYRMKLIQIYMSIFIYLNSALVYSEPRAQTASTKRPEIIAEKTTAKPKLSCSEQSVQIHKICSPDAENQKIKSDDSSKLIDSYDTKSQTKKMLIIKKALSTNIVNNQLVHCETSITEFKKTCPSDKSVTAEDVRLTDYKKNNDKTLLEYKDSYCASVLMPGENNIRTIEDTTNDPNKCKNAESLEFVQKVFDMCTKGTEGYDDVKCKCHIQDFGNSCIPQKTAMEKLESSLKGTSLVDDPNCDTKATPAKSSFDTGKFFSTALALLAIGGLVYLVRKQIKKSDAKNNGTTTDAAGNIVPAKAGSAGSSASSGSCTGTYSGSLDMPEHDVRIANRNKMLREDKNITIPVNEEYDPKYNSLTGGGSPDGGIWLAGAFNFTTGPLVGGGCPITGGEVIIHGHHITISGSVNANKTFSFMHEGGPVTGSVDGNNHVTGKIAEGGGREWVYGNMNGRFIPSK